MGCHFLLQGLSQSRDQTTSPALKVHSSLTASPWNPQDIIYSTGNSTAEIIHSSWQHNMNHKYKNEVVARSDIEHKKKSSKVSWTGKKEDLQLEKMPQGTVTWVRVRSNTNMRKQSRNQRARHHINYLGLHAYDVWCKMGRKSSFPWLQKLQHEEISRCLEFNQKTSSKVT